MRLAVLLAFLLGGCHQVGRADDHQPLLKEESELREAQAAPRVAEAPPAPPLPPGPPGTIARGELVRILDAAPGNFLQHVDSEPRFAGGRFHGWRLVTFFPGDARFRGVDLRAGDVVMRVNGNSVERPEQLLQVWQALRTASELVVDVERAGTPRTLRWTIAP
jgi:type II secretory pathway component PulC